jgi:tetratricopeptide (TPR) repeat protein
MTTNAALDTSAESAVARKEPSSVKPSPARRAGIPWLSLVLLFLSLGLAAFNAWRYWRDTRTVADLKTIASWLSREQYAMAEPALRERLRRSPHDGESRTTLARLLAARGDLRGCALELHEVPFWWPSKAESLYREGQCHLMTDRAQDAEAAWLAVIADDPLHPAPEEVVHDASLELLKLYSTEERWEEVRDVLWSAYERAVTPSDHMTLLGMRMRSEMERLAPESSIAQLRRYVAADPSDSHALRALAKAELALGHKAEADRHFRECLQKRPDDARIWREYLAMLHDQGDQEAWSALLAQVPASAQDDPEIWRFRGLQKEQAGDFAGAAEAYRKSLELNPFVMPTHYRLAMVEERLGHRETAAEHRNKADELREARNELRVAYSDVVNAEDARMRQQPSQPDLATSLKRLADVCERLGWARVAEAWNKLAESESS